ncbi:hypothetical protein Dimus_024271, partial [Dionaea muscipula]
LEPCPELGVKPELSPHPLLLLSCSYARSVLYVAMAERRGVRLSCMEKLGIELHGEGEIGGEEISVILHVWPPWSRPVGVLSLVSASSCSARVGRKGELGLPALSSAL